MVGDKFDIEKSTQAPEDKLLKYLSGAMDEQQRHQYEMENQEDPFWQDAVDGLQQVEDKQQLSAIKLELQSRLLKAGSMRKKRRKNDFVKYATIAILVVLLLGILAYVLIHFSV
jgi:ferric-dicitrate binding protein FerR (iron transport regulator)